jgi:hypothetical protein
MNIPDPIVLEISKAIEQLAFIDRSYNLGIWPNDQIKDDWKHDLVVMRRFDDLKDIRLELLAADNTILFEYRIAFNGRPTTARIADGAKGVEVPVLPPKLRDAIAGKRVIVGHHGKEAQYRHLLRKRWSAAETLAKREGDGYRSNHCEAITGGRERGNFHVAAAGRHCVVVHRCGTRDYAFAKVPDLGMVDIYLHNEYAPPGFRFHVGQRLQCLVIQTPRGLQGRSISAA